MSERLHITDAAGQMAPDLRAVQRVMVVDDSLLERRIIASTLRKRGFEVIEASDASSALNLCREKRPDLILSDWMMPGMTGPDFCRAYRSMSRNRYGYFILLTSKSDAQEVAHGLNAGADDFLTKPVNPDELHARIAAGDRILRMERELVEKNKVISDTLSRLQDIHRRIDADLRQARKIQEALVPSLDQRFSNSRVSLLLKPCGHIGGDLVGMFSPNPDQVVFYNIDVSGHGITSALLTARLASYLSAEHLDFNIAVKPGSKHPFEARPPQEIAQDLNARFVADVGIDQYFTMAYGVADLTNGVVQMVQAGHPHPLFLKSTGELSYIGDGGLPLGLLPDAKVQQLDVTLDPGDRILFYSDGVTEGQTVAGAPLGEDGLMRLVSASAARGGCEFLDDLFWQLTERSDTENGMQDDVSATLFEFGGH